MILAAIALATSVLPAPASAQITRVPNTTLTLPQNPQTFGYSTEDALPGLVFSQPVGLVTPPGETDRIFILEKTGRIQVVTGLASSPVKQLFLDLTVVTGGVRTASEQGVLGLAFHPDFAANHHFYVFYSTTATTSAGTGDHERVSRFTAQPGHLTNAEILATEVPLISQYDEAQNHNGGDLHFGPDGYLYVSLGDEGGGNDQFNNSQRIDKDFFSGLLRIDVDKKAGSLVPNPHPAVHADAGVARYAIPPDNPWVGATSFNGVALPNPANVRTELWAVGLRNPWRFSFDAPTGRLLVGDVGQSAREEVDLVTRGGNYGWSYREGINAGPRGNPPAGAGFLGPIWDTDRTVAGSITGGVVYRGSRFAQLFGQYVFGDYVTNNVFAMTFPASGPVQVTTITSVNGPVAFGADPRNGDILIASINTGGIRRLVYNSTPAGTPLPATLTATGAFSNLATLTPAAGLVAYEPNVSFWSDYAKKRRWFTVPAVANKITFAADGNWTFPAGTVWVKHFDLELTRGDPATARRLETRFIVRLADGIYGVTYRWNAQQTEANLVPEQGADESITINDGGVLRTQTWHYPSRSECLQCHTSVGGQALSFNTAQLNHPYVYATGAANQLTALANAGYFNSSIPDPATLRALAPANDASATLEHRVRSYLAANCVQCHQPGGAALGLWDARIATPTASAGLINGALVNSAGDSANRVIVLGDGAHSMMLTRVSTRGPGQMPPLASNEPDAAGIALLTAWINGFSPPVITAQPQSQTVPVGAGVTFAAAASGTPAPAFQWRKNSVSLGGATAPTLTLNNVQLSDAGTYTVVVTNSVGSVISDPATLLVRRSPPGDFDGDGQSDILWENASNGEHGLWLMNGTIPATWIGLPAIAPNWRIVGNGEFNGDGMTDILWENFATGERKIWLMQGAVFGSEVSLGLVDPNWRMVGTGDFSGDGQTDILWENVGSGDRGLWIMNGTGPAAWINLPSIALDWRIVGAGDFNGDGMADILWENVGSGDRGMWIMNETVPVAWINLPSITLDWRIAGTGDFNGDGMTDILWENVGSGDRGLWIMNGTVPAAWVNLPAIALDWRIVQ